MRCVIPERQGDMEKRPAARQNGDEHRDVDVAELSHMAATYEHNVSSEKAGVKRQPSPLAKCHYCPTHAMPKVPPPSFPDTRVLRDFARPFGGRRARKNKLFVITNRT